MKDAQNRVYMSFLALGFFVEASCESAALLVVKLKNNAPRDEANELPTPK